MAWRNARLAVVLALGGLACGRTELMPLVAETEGGNESSTGSTGGTRGLDSGGPDTGRPTTGLDSGFDSGGPSTGTVTFTTGFDSGVLDTGLESLDSFDSFDSGFPGSSSDSGMSGSETATTTTATSGTDTNGGTTDGGTTGGGTTGGGTTGGGTTDGGTTDGGTTDGATTGGGGLTCLDAVDCVIACGGASPACIGQCNDGLTPEDNGVFTDFETCILFACFGNGSCGFGSFGDPPCVACRVDGQLDPAPLGCDDEAALCVG